MSRLPLTPAITAMGIVFFALLPPAHAQEGTCSSVVTRASVSRCVVEASPSVKSAGVDREVAAARLQAASPWLPSNPVLAVSLATRSHDANPRVANWSATLSQELEIGGQRSARLASAEADRTASSQRFVGTLRVAAVAAWKAYFDVLAAREETTLARRLEALTTSVAETTQTLADSGVVAGIDADLADVSASRARQARIAAEGRMTTSRAVLASLLAVPPESLRVEGELEPLRDVVARARRSGETTRPELGALEWQARAFEARSQLFSRQRIPNLTFSGFVQNDGFNERVLGIGLSLPLPLPFSLGRTYAGEIAEARASARLARAEASRIQSDFRRETAVALADYEARVAERDAVAPARFLRAEGMLSSLAAEVKAGKMAPRDAFVAQQALIDFLQGRVSARRAVCQASVDLARAAGLPLEEGES